MEWFMQNSFALAAGAYGLYSAGKSFNNIRNGTGCLKCEGFGGLTGLALAVYAGYKLYSENKSGRT